MDRKSLLKRLVAYEQPLNDVIAGLSELGWDCEMPQIIIGTEEICTMLTSYLDGNMTEEQMEDWANLIECREDIGYIADKEEVLLNIIHTIANPNLTENLSPTLANSLLRQCVD